MKRSSLFFEDLARRKPSHSLLSRLKFCSRIVSSCWLKLKIDALTAMVNASSFVCMLGSSGALLLDEAICWLKIEPPLRKQISFGTTNLFEFLFKF